MKALGETVLTGIARYCLSISQFTTSPLGACEQSKSTRKRTQVVESWGRMVALLIKAQVEGCPEAWRGGAGEGRQHIHWMHRLCGRGVGTGWLPRLGVLRLWDGLRAVKISGTNAVDQLLTCQVTVFKIHQKNPDIISVIHIILLRDKALLPSKIRKDLI